MVLIVMNLGRAQRAMQAEHLNKLTKEHASVLAQNRAQEKSIDVPGLTSQCLFWSPVLLILDWSPSGS